MTTLEFTATVKMIDSLQRAIRKAKAPNQVIESYLAEMQGVLRQMQDYVGLEADRIIAERKAAGK